MVCYIYSALKVNNRGHLTFDGCDLVELANKYKTPLYVLSENKIRKNCRLFKNSLINLYSNYKILYACKALCNLAICRLVEEEGLGVDVISGGELFTALKAGVSPDKIYFHGNNKTIEELEMALDSNVGHIVIDSFDELNKINSLGEKKNKIVSILVRIKPGVKAHTHKYIQTGQEDSKFGIDIIGNQGIEFFKKAFAMKNVLIEGLHFHIGSQIFDAEDYKLALRKILAFMKNLKENLHFEASELDVGGGFGISYTDEDTPLQREQYVSVIIGALKDLAKKYNLKLPILIIEPGRSIVGDAGVTIYTIGTVKDIPGIRKYVSVDGGMGDNPRPALYGAKYSAVIVEKPEESEKEKVTIAGKYCESGDILIWDIELPRAKIGDHLVTLSTGAYCYSMASNYNRIPRPAMILVNNGRSEIIEKREAYEQLIENDVIPEHLKKFK